MTLPIEGTGALVLAVVFGAIFGLLLHRGGVADYNVIVNQFRLIDFRVLKIMLTAIVVGGVGVLVLQKLGWAGTHLKPAMILGVALGSAIFGVGMVIYGYCPGTGVAAIATGSVHALVGFAGMLVGGILYALSFAWVRDHILGIDIGKKSLADITPIPAWGWLLLLAAVAAVVFPLVERLERRNGRSGRQAPPPSAVGPAMATA
jgi:uncharacterized protein